MLTVILTLCLIVDAAFQGSLPRLSWFGQWRSGREGINPCSRESTSGRFSKVYLSDLDRQGSGQGLILLRYVMLNAKAEFRDIIAFSFPLPHLLVVFPSFHHFTSGSLEPAPSQNGERYGWYAEKQTPKSIDTCSSQNTDCPS